jgi:uncharacterized MAPEG superfamily protein
MEFVVGSVVAAALLIFVSKVPLAIAMSKAEGGYDNNNPRSQQAQLTGFGARAKAAHENTIEAFPVFAAGAILALWSNADVATMQMWCSIFIVCRLAYIALYLMDKGTFRSLVWMVATLSSYALMVQPLL